MMRIKNFNNYLLGGTKESMMRLLSLFMVVTACLGVIATVFISIYQLILKTQIDWLSMAVYIESLVTFAGAGLAGKAYQKKIEDNAIIKQQLENKIDKTQDGRQILND